MPQVLHYSRPRSIRRPRRVVATALIGALAFYVAAYAGFRLSGELIRRIGREGQYVSGHSFVETTFHPAWIVERKARSLIWRIKNGAPLTGHVYWKDLR